MVTAELRRYGGKPLADVLLELANLDEDAYNSLLKDVRGEEAFSRSRPRCEALARSIGAEGPIDAFYLLTAINIVYSNVQDLMDDDDDEIINLVEIVMSGLGGMKGHDEQFETLRDRLVELVAPHPVVDDLRKLNRLKTDLIQNGVGFTSFVDLRPDFAEDRSHIKRLVPVVLFRVSTDSEEDSERSFVFQLTEEALGTLKEAVVDAETKLEAVRYSESLSSMLPKKKGL